MRIVHSGIAVVLFLFTAMPTMAVERGYRDPDKKCLYFTIDPPATFFYFGGKYWTFFENAETLPEAEGIMSDLRATLLMEGIPSEKLPRVLLETHRIIVSGAGGRDVQVRRDGTLVFPPDAKVAVAPGFSIWTRDEIDCVSPKEKKRQENSSPHQTIVYGDGEYQ